MCHRDWLTDRPVVLPFDCWAFIYIDCKEFFRLPDQATCCWRPHTIDTADHKGMQEFFLVIWHGGEQKEK